MKKIMKRLLTGVLTLATVFTALPVTQVHAADSVYTTTDGKAGTIVKIDNGGSEVSSFEESIMNADGQIAYQLAVSYDDGAMGITHVFRGEDLFSSTFYQTAILKELGYPVPTYAHLPLLMDKEGNRLSKRQHGITIRDMRAAGVTAEEIIGKLLFWAGAIPKPEPLSATYAEKNIPFSDCRNLKQKSIIVR